MNEKILKIAMLLCLALPSCGDPPAKEDPANSGVNSTPNSAPDGELLAWCEANQQSVECARDAESFFITMNIVEGCGDFDRPDCGVTPEILQTCIDAITECPQTGTSEEHFAETCLNEALSCTFDTDD